MFNFGFRKLEKYTHHGIRLYLFDGRWLDISDLSPDRVWAIGWSSPPAK